MKWLHTLRTARLLFEHVVQSPHLIIATSHARHGALNHWQIDRLFGLTTKKASLCMTDPVAMGNPRSPMNSLYKRTVIRRSFNTITPSCCTIIFVISGIITDRADVSLFKYTTQRPHSHRQGISYSPRCYMGCHEGSQCDYRCQGRASANSPCDPSWCYIQHNSLKTVSLNFNFLPFTMMGDGTVGNGP